MKKKYNHYLTGLLFLTFFAACNKEDVQPFSERQGINFMERTEKDNEISYGDGYTNLSTHINYITAYSNSYEQSEIKEITLRVKLEGLLSDTPLKVKFKILPVEGYDIADVSVPETGIEIKSGEYTADITVGYRKPAVAEKTYKAQIAIDYENSDVVAGTKERQLYTLIIEDAFVWSTMKVTSQEEWEKYFKTVLGDYGTQKVRFLIYAFKQLNLNLESASMYTKDYPSYADRYGLQAYMPRVIEFLNAYNAEHSDAQVQESDGTPVTFPQS